ncbi:MAG: VCBS repeat-containing protein [Myxococcota bacterium]
MVPRCVSIAVACLTSTACTLANGDAPACETACGSSAGSSVTGLSSGGAADSMAVDTTAMASGDADTTAATSAATGLATTGGESGSSDGTDTGGTTAPSYRCGDATLPMMDPSFAAPIELQSSGGTGGTAAGDLDGDGRDELVAQILFRIYDLGDEGWQSHQPLANLDGRGDRFAGDLEIGDINGDGAPDIVVPDSDNSGTSGALSWFENPGSLDGQWVEHVVETFDGQGEGNVVTHLSELEVGDIDGDGWLDLVVRDISHGVWVVMQQTGGGGFHPRTFIPVLPREGLALWDPDLDGRLDILLNGVWLQTPEDPVRGDYVVRPIVGMEDWYAPDASTNSIRDYASKVLAADFDGDGRVDVLIDNAEELAGNSPNKPRGIAVYLQPEDPIADTWTEVVITDLHWAWHTMMVADYDFDGTPDVLAAISAVGTDDAADEITLFLNDGSGQAFAPQTVSTAHTVYQGIIADPDADGDCDLLAPDHFNNGPVRYFENTTVP